MTDIEIKSAIKGAVPAGRQDADAIANAAFKRAILRVGRMNSNINEQAVEISLTANRGLYEVGKDIVLPNATGLRGISLMNHTDTVGGKIEILPVERWNDQARGGTTTGRPTIATVHSNPMRVEFYPKPDSAYRIWMKVKKRIDNLADIPDEFHDLIVDEGVSLIQAMTSFEVAMKNVSDGRRDVEDDSPTGYRGDIIRPDRIVGSVKNRRPTSWNLTGN